VSCDSRWGGIVEIANCYCCFGGLKVFCFVILLLLADIVASCSICSRTILSPVSSAIFCWFLLQYSQILCCCLCYILKLYHTVLLYYLLISKQAAVAASLPAYWLDFLCTYMDIGCSCHCNRFIVHVRLQRN
jgi:hypothetical protein